MKKLAIMFVMLLGSVATMQAQSFNFSCIVPTEASGDFTGAQVDVLVAAGFIEDSAGVFEKTSDDEEFVVQISPNSDGSYLVTDDQFGDVINASSDTLSAAIDAANNAVTLEIPEENVDNGADNGAGTNPDADNDGFLDADEVTMSDYNLTEVSAGVYQLTGATKHVTVTPSGLFAEADNVEVHEEGVPLYIMNVYTTADAEPRVAIATYGVGVGYRLSIGDVAGSAATTLNSFED